MEAKGEKLLQDLVSQEKVLIAKVDDAKAEAAKILEEAHAKASSLISKAKEQGQAMMAEQAKKTASETATVKEDLLQGIKTTVSQLDSLAKANTDKAVTAVLERVVP